MTQNFVQFKNPCSRALFLVVQPWLSRRQLDQIISQLIISAAISNHSTTRKILTLLTTPPNAYVAKAYTLFRFIPYASTSLYNTMIKIFVENNQPKNALFMCRKMMGSDHFPNNYTFSFVFRACREVGDGSLGLMYHTLVVKLGWEGYDFVKNGLIHFYAGNNCMDFARRLFDQCAFRDVITWSVMINGYLKSGELSFAKELFDQMPEKNVVCWSVMINGCSQMGFFREGMEFFVDMMDAGFRPNRAAVVGALTACSFLGNLDWGRWIHAYVERSEIEFDTVLGTALVGMYAKCGCVDMACHVFEEIPCKDIVAYTSLISGLADHGEGKKVLEVFERMKTGGIRPNEITLLGVLSACSRAGLVEEGLGIFESMKVEYGIEPMVKHYGCLVDLLGRSGRLEQAKEVLRKMPMEPDQYVVGALLNACRVHGYINIESEMAKWLEETIPHSSGGHVLLSNIYATSDQWDNVQKLRKRMQEKQVEKTPGYSFVASDEMV